MLTVKHLEPGLNESNLFDKVTFHFKDIFRLNGYITSVN